MLSGRAVAPNGIPERLVEERLAVASDESFEGIEVRRSVLLHPA
jgi:hypothetical protein